MAGSAVAEALAWVLGAAGRCPIAPAAMPDFAALVGAAGWARLGPEIRRRFGRDHGAAVYPGAMTLRRSWIGAAFAVLARLFGSPLPLAQATDAPAEVDVHPDGRGGVVWARRLHVDAAAPPLLVRSTKRCAADGRLLECVDGGLGMVLDVVEEAGAMVFLSRSYFLALGAWRLPLPGWLTPGRCRVAHVAIGPGWFRFELEMRHPLFGVTFHQVGLFRDPEA